MAILWWIATGTYNKMESDVRNTHPGQAYWIPFYLQGEVPLQIDHLLLGFMVLGFSLILSTFVFFGELMMYNQYRKVFVRKASVSFTQAKKRNTATKILVKERTPPNTIVPDPSRSLANVSENLINPDSGDTESGTHHIDHAIEELIEVIE